VMLPLVGVVIGAVLGYFFQRVAASISRRELWSDRASEALADVELLLTDTHPHRVTMNMNRDTIADQVTMLREGRGPVVRRGLAVLVVGYPDAQIRATARELEVAIFNTLASLTWLVGDMLVYRDVTEPEQALPKALGNHEHATRLKEVTVERLHMPWRKRRTVTESVTRLKP
jgi:hypothetical protein